MGEKEGKEEKEKKEEKSPVLILKVDMHCEGCASKIKRFVRRFEGVEGVTADIASSKLTVKGTVDPWMIRDRVEEKARTKVEILSPVNLPKKEIAGGEKKPAPAGDAKVQKKVKKPSKEIISAVLTTVVLQIRLHCDGCIQRIKKTILKVKGVQEVSVDAKKDIVTVKGTMDVISLPLYLKDKLKRSVEIVSAKAGGGDGGGEKKVKIVAEKTNDKEGGGGEKKEKEGGGGGGGGGEKKEEAVKVVAAAAKMATTGVVETNFVDYHQPFDQYKVQGMLHAPQLFSDENPNACSIM